MFKMAPKKVRICERSGERIKHCMTSGSRAGYFFAWRFPDLDSRSFLQTGAELKEAPGTTPPSLQTMGEYGRFSFIIKEFSETPRTKP
jgi:hypothetical protein